VALRSPHLAVLRRKVGPASALDLVTRKTAHRDARTPKFDARRFANKTEVRLRASRLAAAIAITTLRFATLGALHLTPAECAHLEVSRITGRLHRCDLSGIRSAGQIPYERATVTTL
jgi:hypothetical protein